MRVLDALDSSVGILAPEAGQRRHPLGLRGGFAALLETAYAIAQQTMVTGVA